jgi:nifR3 family TIM-barrel protein
MSKLSPFSIGSVKIAMPVILAPMAGYTDMPYRLLCRRRGAPYCVTEMMLDRMILLRNRLQQKMMLTCEEDRPCGAQIVGNEPPVVAEAAQELCRRGFDVIDLNFACPVHKALSRRRGGYMLNQPQKVLEIIRAVAKVVDRPLTVKLRRRFKAGDTDAPFWHIAEGAFDAGAAAVCVHARSVEAKYSGAADWEFLAEVKRHFHNRTIIGSGDVLLPARALEMLEKTHVDAVAVARGALGNPWFFRQVQDLAAGREPYHPDLTEQRELLLAHFAHAEEIYGEDRAPKIMRGFGVRYARLHPTPKDIRMAFVRIKKSADWKAVVDGYYPAGK